MSSVAFSSEVGTGSRQENASEKNRDAREICSGGSNGDVV
jgi:hypothetical protein